MEHKMKEMKNLNVIVGTFEYIILLYLFKGWYSLE